MKIILASSSKTRRKILDNVGLKYEVVASDIDEVSNETDPRKYVEELSRNKAECVKEKIKDKEAIIIAADSIIYKNGKRYEKPKCLDEERNNLKEFSGSKNQGITGVTLIDLKNNQELTFSCVTDVYFKKIIDSDIDYYLKHEKDILYKAGYSLEGIMSLFLDKIEGDYYNVLGLPIGMIYSKLNEMGYSLKNFE